MRRALELAERGWGRVSPNPMVGAVVRARRRGDRRGLVRGPEASRSRRGAWRCGRPATAASGATVVCTLEPCDQFGRTPPCTRALHRGRRAPRGRGGATDPNLGVDAPRRRASCVQAGIERRDRMCCEHEARALNVAFEHHVTDRAAVRGAEDGVEPRRQDGGRRRHLPVDHGRGRARRRPSTPRLVRRDRRRARRTAIADDPALTVRGAYAGHRHAPRCGSWSMPRARVPATLRLFDESAPTLVATTDRASDAQVRAWAAAGADVAVLDRDADGGRRADRARRGARQARRPGRCSSRAARRSPGAPSATASSTVSSCTSRPCSSGVERPDDAGRRRVRADRRGLRLGPLAVERIGDDLKVVADVHGHR